MKYIVQQLLIIFFLIIGGVQTFSQTSPKGKGDVWVHFELKIKTQNFKTDSLRIYAAEYGLEGTSYHINGQTISVKGKVLARLQESPNPFMNKIDFPNILIESKNQTTLGRALVTDILSFEPYYKEINPNTTYLPLHITHSFEITKTNKKDYSPRYYTINLEQRSVKTKDLYSMIEKLPFVAIKYEIPKK